MKNYILFKINRKRIEQNGCFCIGIDAKNDP